MQKAWIIYRGQLTWNGLGISLWTGN